MAKLPDWIKYEGVSSKDGKYFWNFSVKYIPLRFFLGVIRKSISWRIWQYPKVVRACLDRIGIVFRPLS